MRLWLVIYGDLETKKTNKTAIFVMRLWLVIYGDLETKTTNKTAI